MKKVVITFVVLFSAFITKAEDLFKNKPYLQNPTNGGITLTWVVSKPSLSYVEYGTDPDNLQKAYSIVDGQIIAGNEINNIRLKDIQPDVRYYYRAVSVPFIKNEAYDKVFGEKQMTEICSFEIPSEDADTKVLVLNDLHKMNHTVDKIAEQTAQADYDLVIFNGDCIDDPWGRQNALEFVAYLSEKLGRGSVPFVFVRGNHEIRGSYSVFLRELVEYPAEQSYGGFTWGNTRYVVLDGGEDKPDDHPAYYGLNDFAAFRAEQADFLARELKTKAFRQADHRVLVHHIPIYKDEGYYNPCYELWHPILKKADFAVAIHGHTHKPAHYAKGQDTGNNFPLVIGGGHKLEEATIIYVESKGKTLTTTMYDLEGKELAKYVDKK